MKTRLLILFTVIVLAAGNVLAQEDFPVRDEGIRKPPVVLVLHRFDFGLGFGMDYGGVLGVQFGIAPVQHLTIFAAGGYDLIGFGWQVGLKGLVFPKDEKHVARPFCKVMYGSNSVIVVSGAEELNKIYNGFTPGIGLELRFGRKKSNGFDIDLNVPIRSQEFWDDWNEIKNDPAFAESQGPLPVSISAGFHHEF